MSRIPDDARESGFERNDQCRGGWHRNSVPVSGIESLDLQREKKSPSMRRQRIIVYFLSEWHELSGGRSHSDGASTDKFRDS